MSIKITIKSISLSLIMLIGLVTTAYSETNIIFQTVPYEDLSGRSIGELEILLNQLETTYDETKVYVSEGNLRFLSADERIAWERDLLIWKIISARMSLYVNDKVKGAIKSDPDSTNYFTLENLLNEMDQSKSNAQQSGAGYPPQGVGSPDP